jgi:hypothetical protein
MLQTIALPGAASAVARQRIYEIPAAKLLLRDFCTAPIVSSLKPDSGLRAFARLPEREHQHRASLLGKPPWLQQAAPGKDWRTPMRSRLK